MATRGGLISCVLIWVSCLGMSTNSPYFRPVRVKQVSTNLQVQNANTQTVTEYEWTRGLVSNYRVYRYLLSFSGTPGSQAVSVVCISGHSLRIPSTYLPASPPSCMLVLLPWREPSLLQQESPIGRLSFRNMVSTDVFLRGWDLCAICSSERGVDVGTMQAPHQPPGAVKAFFLALQHFHLVLTGHPILTRTNNMTVVSYINGQGGTYSLLLLKLSCSLLLWCSAHFLFLKTTNIPGHLNLRPDLFFRAGPLVFSCIFSCFL